MPHSVDDFSGTYSGTQTCSMQIILLYADDIVLIAASVCELECLLRHCECELYSLDMAINFKKCNEIDVYGTCAR